MRSNDTRIVYGARCLWWDSIDKVSHVGSSRLPCCPHCGSVLFECPTLDDFMKGAAEYEQQGHPDYQNQLKWMRGRCFRTLDEATRAYQAQKEPSK